MPSGAPTVVCDDGQVPQLSVVIAYFRSQATLALQLDALACQITDRSYDVIVADNEGSEELKTIVSGYRDRLDIRIVDASDVPGRSHASNAGARVATSPYLALCDSDDVVSPTWVEAMCATLDTGDVLATGPLRLDRLNPPYVWRTYLSSGASVDPVDDQSAMLGTIRLFDYLPFVFGCNLGVRRSTYFAVGEMDESQLSGSEDVEFSWRAQEAGYQIAYNPDAIVDYRLRSNTRQVFAQRRSYSRSQLRLWRLSVILGRPVRGMSMRWAVSSTAKLPFEYLRVRRQTIAHRYAFAYRAGAIVGNLEGQLRERVFSLRFSGAVA